MAVAKYFKTNINLNNNKKCEIILKDGKELDVKTCPEWNGGLTINTTYKDEKPSYFGIFNQYTGEFIGFITIEKFNELPNMIPSKNFKFENRNNINTGIQISKTWIPNIDDDADL